MKKVIVMLSFCLLGVSLFAQEQVEVASQPSAKKTVAVLEFEGGSGQDAITLADLFGSQLANKNVFNVLTRTRVEAIMKEQKFQRSGVTDTESIKAIGELINADYIVVGKISMLGDMDLLTVQMIDVVTGQVEVGGHESFEKIEDIEPYIKTMVDNIAAIETEPVTKAYKIGATGPGGGLVFHIKGNKYLEVSENLGEGTWSEAIEMGKNYRGGGYSDWYLPSAEELNYIYENLRVPGHIKDNDWFWSSSEVYSYSDAWLQYFGNGDQSYGSKPYNNNVRVVRAF